MIVFITSAFRICAIFSQTCPNKIASSRGKIAGKFKLRQNQGLDYQNFQYVCSNLSTLSVVIKITKSHKEVYLDRPLPWPPGLRPPGGWVKLTPMHFLGLYPHPWPHPQFLRGTILHIEVSRPRIRLFRTCNRMRNRLRRDLSLILVRKISKAG